jgi:hypothetical protein
MMRTKRLLSDKPTDLERMLLEAAVKERPSEGQRMRVRRVLSEAGSASMAAVGAGTLATKVAIVGVVAAALVGFAALQRARSTHQELVDVRAADAEVQVVPMEERAPMVAPATMTVALDQDPTAKGEGDGLRSRPSALPRAAAGALKPRTGPDPVRLAAKAGGETSDVRDQIRMIDEARAAMGRSNPSAALRTIDGYVAKYPEGMFRQEARILRILALDDRGDHTRATALARAFLASYPTSAHVARIERIATR